MRIVKTAELAKMKEWTLFSQIRWSLNSELYVLCWRLETEHDFIYYPVVDFHRDEVEKNWKVINMDWSNEYWDCVWDMQDNSTSEYPIDGSSLATSRRWMHDPEEKFLVFDDEDVKSIIKLIKYEL